MSPLAITAIGASSVMFLAWLWQMRSNKSGIVDAIWALGIAVCSVFYALVGSGIEMYRIVVGLIAGLWFLRLGSFIFRRIMRETDDGRYKAMTEHFGQRAQLFYFFYYQFQAGLIWLCAWPMWVIAENQSPVNYWLIALAIVIALVALIGETTADQQLTRFRFNPENKGKTCRLGLWRYSRHPNYFFEWSHWFAYPILAIGAAGGAWVWLAPFIMLLFLYFITGIPYTEMQAIRSRGDDYRDYQRTTSPFIPWIPRL